MDLPTELTRRVLSFFGLDSVEKVLHSLNARDSTSSADIGRLAPILLDDAEDGDVAARYIVRGHGAMLGDYALAAAHRVGLEDIPFTVTLSCRL